MYFTYEDAVLHAVDYLGGTPDALAVRDARRSVLQAYRDLVNARVWTYLYSHDRIQLHAPYLTGTVSYLHTGGTYPRQLTLVGGVWPTWAGPGCKVRVGVVTNDVAERKSDTVLTFTDPVNPGSDLAATEYTLYQDDYLLPADFVKQDTAIFEGNFGGLTYADPTDQLWFQRFTYSSGTPRFFTIRGNPLFLGRLTAGLFPYPDQAKTLDFMYQRRSRDLRWESYAVGTVAVDAGMPTVVTGSGASFGLSLAGSVLRLGTQAAVPTSWIGTSPPTQEVRIAEVLGPTQLRAEAALDPAAAVKYTISDPIDIEWGAMGQAFLRGIEKQLSVARRIPDKPDAFTAYSDALKEAMAADSRSYQGRVMGPGRTKSVPVKYYPVRWS